MRFPAGSAALVVYACLAVSGVAGAAEFEAAIGKKVTGSCHMGNCSFFILQNSLPIATLQDGTLFAVSGVAWSAGYASHPEADDDYAFPPTSVGPKNPDAFVVFCSKSRPRIFFYSGHAWDSLPLRPGDESAMGSAVDSAYAQYWAACHKRTGGDIVAAELARKLGYHVAARYGQDGRDAVHQPSDLLR